MTTFCPETLGPKRLEATLRKITEGLAEELACPTRCAPDWSDLDWTVARAVAAMHGVSSVLSRTLQWQGPVGWMQFLTEQRDHTSRRHARIATMLELIDQRMREAGIAATALKGVALHTLGIYAAGDRPMADIDLLVRPSDAEKAVRVIESLSFHQVYATWKEAVFMPIVRCAPAVWGEHSDNDMKIELHTRICEKLPWRITDVSELIFAPRPRPGLNVYPSIAALMTHLLLHAAGSMKSQGLRLMQLNDVAQLSSRMSQSDWDEVLAHNSPAAPLWWAFPPLRLLSRYYSSSVPADVLAALAAECPTVLARVAGQKCLYDVSYSYLWVDAFPGIEWARSIGEVLEYVVNRVRPSAAQMALREQYSKDQSGANQDQWIRLSQTRRILRWVTSRPTRVIATHAVYAALAQAR